MAITVNDKNLGHATAYAYAVAGGYTGTEEEYTELMGSVATIAESAAESARQAAGSADNANADSLKAEGLAVGEQNGAEVGSGSPYYHNNAKYYKEQAANSATTASNKAGEASDSAVTAGQKADAASGSASSAAAGALKAEGYAQGKQNGTDVASGSPYYHANAKYYSDQASGSATTAGQKATAASGSATTAGDKALIAEGYANGKQNGSDVASGSPYYHNNSKYYSDQAAGSAEAAAASAQSVSDSAAQIQTNKEDIEDLQEGKANKDGSYENMTVGNAEQLVSTVFVEDNEPYQFRTAGGSADIGDREYDEIVGGTVAWNQLIQNGDFSDGTSNWEAENPQYSTLSVSNGVLTATVIQQPTEFYNLGIRNGYKKIIKDHKYFFEAIIKSSYNGWYGWRSSALTVGRMIYLVNAVADQWTYGAMIVNAIESGNSRLYFAPSNINSFQVGDVIQYKKFQMFDLTQMFGSTIADYIYNLEQANAGAGVAFFKKLFPKPYYEYNAGELMSVKTSAHETVGFNQFGGIVKSGKAWVNGVYTNASSNYAATETKIKCIPNTTYCFSIPNSSVYPLAFYIQDFDANGNWIRSNPYRRGVPENRKYATFTTNNDTHFISFYMYRIGGISDSDVSNICINLSWDGERDGEYEPYVKHSYSLDDSLELRGIPKLDANNKLYYDGDTYSSDGTVTRRITRIELDGVTAGKKFSGAFGAVTNGYAVYLSLSDYDHLSGTHPEVWGISNRFVYGRYVRGDAPTFQFGGDDGSNTTMVFILPSTITTVDEANTWLQNNPTTIEYISIATPTTEEADPFASLQIVNDFGTEEYVVTEQSGVAVPVGHITKYANNLRAKLEMAPESPNGDGDYIVRQTNGQNTYVPLVIPNELPTAPTENGNYILKCTVSGGTPTYSWEVQS